ncbi:MAG: DUF6794 domain-containing protein [Chthoniobacterales bacterium]
MRRRLLGIGPRTIGLLCVLCLIASPQAEAGVRKKHQNKAPGEIPAYVPKDLEDCFRELDKLWSQEQREEFRKKPEEKLIEYHFELGMWMRNRWALWAGSRLQQYFAALGVSHPESISMIIITSYWRRENHREIKLEEQIAHDRAAWEQQGKEQREEEVRAAAAFEKVRELMLGFAYVSDSPATVTMKKRSDDGIRARFLARFRGGVILTIREFVSSEGRDDTYRLVPYFLDLTKEQICPVQLPEMTEIAYSVVAGDWLWVVGKSKEALRLVALSQVTLVLVDLPRSDEIPQLGLSGDRVLLVYSNAIYRREEQTWTQLYSGEVKLPLSGPPPRQYGDKVYFRDEGREENEKQLSYLELDATPRVVTVWKETDLVGPSGPRWENTFGYCVLADGTLWATFGEGFESKSVLRRQPNGDYRIAVFNNRVALQGDLLGRSGDEKVALVSSSASGWKQLAGEKPKGKGADLSISGIAAKPNGDLIAVADTGLFRVADSEIRKLISFRNTHQLIPLKDGHVSHWDWDPTDILFLSDNSYLITSTFGGIYVLRQDEAKRWSLKSLDERLGKPLIW